MRQLDWLVMGCLLKGGGVPVADGDRLGLDVSSSMIRPLDGSGIVASPLAGMAGTMPLPLVRLRTPW